MSDSILKALMQLFAIIASSDSKFTERQAIITTFLNHELNINSINEYVNVFEKFYQAYHHPQSSDRKKRKRTAASSVKILRICSEIHEKLSEKQIFIVLIRLFEFIKFDAKLNSQEIEFVKTVAEVFEIKTGTFNQIKSFAYEQDAMKLDYQQILIISSTKSIIPKKCKYKKVDGFMGNLAVLNLKSANLFLIRYFGIHELYLNNQTIRRGKIYVLNTDASIKSPVSKAIYFNDVYRAFNKKIEDTQLVFEASNLYLRFKNGHVGLHNISFKETSGKLIGIMGTSGTGKTTLLNVLNGINKPIHGKVLLNGTDIHSNEAKINGLIGYVSQSDYLIEELSVFQNLYFNAKLSFSGHDKNYIIRKTNESLQMLGLLSIKDLKVGNILDKIISGGQRKRLNIALELIREPSILFLDEPTSGLSSKDSEIIIDLLKNLTLRGKLIFNVIHQPSSDIFKMFDKLYVIDHGGYLIYDGNPVNAIKYFKNQINLDDFDENICHACGNVKPEQIFNIIEANIVDEYGNETRTRKKSPSEWYEIYKEKKKEKKKLEVEKLPELPNNSVKIPSWIEQFSVFVKRDILSKFSNKQYLFVNLFEAPILAFMLSYIIKYYDVSVIEGYVFGRNTNFPIYIFISVIISLFIGLSVSAQEIIKDKKILERERFLHLSRSSYLISKLSILFFLSAIQAFSFVLVGNLILEIKTMFFAYWLVLFSSWFFGNVLGLLISDSFKTTVTIYILIPFLIIPQLLLSGVIVQFDKINPQISKPGNIPWYGEIIASRWAYEALAVHQFKNNEYEKHFFKYDKLISQATYKRDYWISSLKTEVLSSRNLIKDGYSSELENNLKLIKNEISKEISINNKFTFQHLNELEIGKFSSNISYKTEEYLDSLMLYYQAAANKMIAIRNKKIRELEKEKGGRLKFSQWELEQNNQGLDKFVKNSSENSKISKVENTLYQKTNPIFKDPTSNFIKSHFYASRKKVLGIFLDTFWVNIAVIWFMSLSLYIAIYYQLLSKLLKLFDRKFKK